MEYFVQRGDQKFGPYTLSDLQRYVQSGNIALTDLAKSEGMVEWIPVSQVLGDIPAALIAPWGAIAAAPGNSSALVPLPPNLHWGWLLLLSVCTLNIFYFIWAAVEANWARKLNDSSKPLVLVLIAPAAFFAAGVASTDPSTQALDGLFRIAGAVSLIWGMFSIRAAMEEYYNSKENIGLSLSGVVTFFFGVLYFQYYINRLARWKKTGVLEGGSSSSAPSIIHSAIQYHKDTRLIRDSDPEAK